MVTQLFLLTHAALVRRSVFGRRPLAGTKSGIMAKSSTGLLPNRGPTEGLGHWKSYEGNTALVGSHSEPGSESRNSKTTNLMCLLRLHIRVAFSLIG